MAVKKAEQQPTTTTTTIDCSSLVAEIVAINKRGAFFLGGLMLRPKIFSGIRPTAGLREDLSLRHFRGMLRPAEVDRGVSLSGSLLYSFTAIN